MKNLFRKISALGMVAAGVGLTDYASDQSISRNLRAVACAVKITLAYKFSSAKTQEELDATHREVANEILRTCQTNGGLYIKLGQGIASMNHVLPEEYTEILSVLQDRAKSIPYSDVEYVFLRDFGKRPLELFETFEQEPVASASVAQVHIATTKSGKKVAVKVVKPQVERQTPWDLLCYKPLVFSFEKIFELPMYWTTDYTCRHLRQELDFVHEAQNSERCMKNLNGRTDAYVPEVHWDYTRKGVLTTEWIDGVKFTNMEAIQAMGLNPSSVTKTMVEIFADQIFCSGNVHCDPHPGNLLVRPASSKSLGNSKHQLCLLDHGLYIEEPEKFRRQYCEFWCGVFLRDMPTLQKICKEWGVHDVDFFASLQLFRPFSRNARHEVSAPVTRHELHNFESQAKDKLQKLLSNTELVPRELIFLGRSMNLVRFNNKVVGSLVNRLNIFAISAAKGLGMFNQTSSGDSTRQTSWSNLRLWSPVVVFKFQLLLHSIGFFLFRWMLIFRHLVNLVRDQKGFGSFKVPYGVEDVLEEQEKKVFMHQLGFSVKKEKLG